MTISISVCVGFRAEELLSQALDSSTPKIQEQEEPRWPYFLLLETGMSHILTEDLLGFSYISRRNDSVKLFLKYFKAAHHLKAHTGAWCLPTGQYVHVVPAWYRESKYGFCISTLAKYLMKVATVVLTSAIAETFLQWCLTVYKTA